MSDDWDEDRFFDNFPYRVCPAQVDGFTPDGRPFYYRCRHDRWTIAIGKEGWGANCLSWPDSYAMYIEFYGDGDITRGADVDALLDEKLGEGWRQATYEETLIDQTCKCGRVFKTQGSTICSECLLEKLRG